MKIGFQQQNSSLLRTTWMLQLARNAQRIGLGRKSISAQTCDEDLPRLIPQVTTTIAPIPDRHALEDGARHLRAARIARHPQHLVDAGYIDAEALVTSQTD